MNTPPLPTRNGKEEKVEALFAELKNQIGLRRLRRMKFVRGSYSADPPYTILEVLGILLSDRIKAELSQYGFNEFHPDSVGFHAVRPVPLE